MGTQVCTQTEKSRDNERVITAFCGGDEGDRTPYLLNAIQALSQVSYTPTAIEQSVS